MNIAVLYLCNTRSRVCAECPIRCVHVVVCARCVLLDAYT
nr:MAG TPA: hypothetical protein [Caudoviricetes sp.]